MPDTDRSLELISDTALFSRFAATNDERTFEEIVRRFENKLYNFLYRYCGERDLAQDVLQEVFIKAYFNIPKLKSTSFVSAWMYKIAVNTAISQLRRRRYLSLVPFGRNDDTGDQAIDIEDDAPLSQQTLEERERARSVQQAISKLPEKYRAVIVLQYIADLPLTEISLALGKPVGTIKSLSSRGRELLKKELSSLKEEQ